MQNTPLFFYALLILFVSCSFDNPKKQEFTDNYVKDTINLNGSEKFSELQNTLPEDFIIIKQSYFIIASNLSETQTRKIIDNTIIDAVNCFYNDYFQKKPDEYTTIFLFKDDSSYRTWAYKLYGDEDLSRFGYYKPGSKVMLMNISTGTGTLVHELTHALVRYDFPGIPSWFNEGLGSLYERSSLSNKDIKGYVNWRLPILQKAIILNKYPSLKLLLSTTDEEFYGENSNINYAEARYLCMYLQEKNLLKTYYKNFRDSFNNDETGISQIKQVLQTDLNVIERDFISWAKTLNYNE